MKLLGWLITKPIKNDNAVTCLKVKGKEFYTPRPSKFKQVSFNVTLVTL